MRTVPVLINGASLRTVIGCTNGDTGSVTIGVDVYGAAGAYVTGNSLTVSAGSTVLFGTGSVTDMSLDVNLATGIISKGHARVFASGSKVLCSAFLADGASGVPSASLTIAKKFSQKGD